MNRHEDLRGHSIIVTGGRSGIGRAIVESLLEQGARVASLDVAPIVEPAHDDRLDLVVDVRDPDAVADAMDAVIEFHESLFGVVLAAGITRDRMLWKLSLTEWRDVLEVNLTGAFNVLHAATPHLRRGNGGAIVAISSINALRGKMGQANYAASKAGLIALMKNAARELGAFGIRANTVAPGWVDTPMTASLPPEARERALAETVLGRVTAPADVAAAVLFLLSDAARQITGVTLRVDGGQLIGGGE